MMGDTGGWLWLLIDVVFVVVLGVGLIYGIGMWRKRRRSPRTEQATRELYRREGEKERREADARPMR